LWEQAEAKLTDAEKRLTVGEGEKKDQGLLLEMARQALFKREDSSVLMISMIVVNAMALVKSHLPDLDVELLLNDFAVDEAEREALTSGAYDAAHEFTCLMISLALPSPKIMTILRTCNSSPVCCNRFLLIRKKLFDSFQIPDGYRYIDVPYFSYTDEDSCIKSTMIWLVRICYCYE
jgi:hypothetical protein